jgi:hypothetical protein
VARGIPILRTRFVRRRLGSRAFGELPIREGDARESHGMVATSVEEHGVTIAGSSRPERTDPSERARSILSERYARGELSTEEYRERLSELQ